MSEPVEARYQAILKRYWGYDSFRPLQLDAIKSIASGQDTLVLMPTGGGKSIIYQVPTLASTGVCIVITPLIALMKDQVDRLRKHRILAEAIHAGRSHREIDRILDNCIYGDVKFLYISPERIDSEMFRMRCARMDVALIAVDEAHCISQWGYDFRPSYLQIARLRDLCPNTPILALTASATPKVAEDIMYQLRFDKPNIKRMSFARSNLAYVVRHTEDKREHLLRIVNNVSGSGIVYVRTREKSETITQFLQQNGITADFYHGGLGFLSRNLKQEQWINGQNRIMVATNAFGMGIDKADVRFVITIFVTHWRPTTRRQDVPDVTANRHMLSCWYRTMIRREQANGCDSNFLRLIPSGPYTKNSSTTCKWLSAKGKTVPSRSISMTSHHG